MDHRLLDLSRAGRLFPQSPDEDLASRLVLWSAEAFRAAAKLGGAHPRSVSLLSYLSVFHLLRALISVKGYRLSDNDPHDTAGRLAGHFLGEGLAGPLAVYGRLRERWDVSLRDPDMPDAPVAPAEALAAAAAVRAGLRKIFEKEFPAFRPLFRSSPRRRTVSPERAFRE